MTESLTTGEKFAKKINLNLDNAAAQAYGQVNDGQKVNFAIEVEDEAENFKPHQVLDLDDFEYSVLAGGGWSTERTYVVKYSVTAEEQDYREAVQEEMVESFKHLRQAILKAHQCKEMEYDEERLKELRDELNQVMEDNREGMEQ